MGPIVRHRTGARPNQHTSDSPSTLPSKRVGNACPLSRPCEETTGTRLAPECGTTRCEAAG
jgi:hypothetical protein